MEAIDGVGCIEYDGANLTYDANDGGETEEKKSV